MNRLRFKKEEAKLISIPMQVGKRMLFIKLIGVNILDILGVTIPVLGEIPVTTITDCEQYKGIVTWSPTASAFGRDRVYTATITLTANFGYTFEGIDANTMEVSGADTVTNPIGSKNTLVVTAAFPKTASLPKQKIIMFYRNETNSEGADVCYTICSGSYAGHGIQLFSSDVNERAQYSHSFKDFKNRIWVEADFRTEVGTTFCQAILYTYPNSCQSWKYRTGTPAGIYPDGWDLWYSPCGKLLASGQHSTNIVKRRGTKALTFAQLSSLNCGPHMRTDAASAPTFSLGVMGNGELIMAKPLDNGVDVIFDLYYLSSNETGYPSGNWHKTLTINNEFAASGNNAFDRCVCCTNDNVSIFMTSGGYLVGNTSTDYARNWDGWEQIEYVGKKYWGYRDFIPVVLSQNYPDNYARFIVTKYYGEINKTRTDVSATVNNLSSKSGQIWIYKVNTSDFSDYTAVKTANSGLSYNKVMIGLGEHKDGLNVFSYPQGSGSNIPGGVGAGDGSGLCPGDPRVVHYWNETTGVYGHYQFNNTTPAGCIHASHIGGAARINNANDILAIGAGYFGTDGNPAAKGLAINPDLCSGSSVTSFGRTINDIKISSGAGGGSFEILENRI